MPKFFLNRMLCKPTGTESAAVSPLAIETEALSKSFPSSTQKKRCALPSCNFLEILKNVDLRIAKGEVAALMGPNGCGKTTLLKILAGLVLPDSGIIRINGKTVASSTCGKSRGVSLLLADESVFYPRLTGYENLRFYGQLYRIPDKNLFRDIEEISDWLKIEDLHKPFQTYSSGLRKRLSLARCFLNQSPILLLDEPARSLDPEYLEYLDHELPTYARKTGATILLTTHLWAQAERLQARVLLLNEGFIRPFTGSMPIASTAGETLGSLR